MRYPLETEPDLPRDAAVALVDNPNDMKKWRATWVTSKYARKKA